LVLTVAGSTHLLDLEFDFIDFLFPVTLPTRLLAEAALAVGRRHTAYQIPACAQALAPVYYWRPKDLLVTYSFLLMPPHRI
jgi:hypothetical protein